MSYDAMEINGKTITYFRKDGQNTIEENTPPEDKWRR